MSYLASEIMDGAAALLNDTQLSVYSYTAQIPYLNIALTDLREEYQLSNSPISNETSAVIEVAAGVEFLDFTTSPALPTGLMEIQQAWSRQDGTNNSFLPMDRMDFIPHYLQISPSAFQIVQIYSWQEPKLKFVAAIGATEIKLDYIKSIFTTVLNAGDTISVQNGKNYLVYKTAALCAKYISENQSRSDELNLLAVNSLDRAIGISTKGRQAITTRRRPFRSGFKSTGTYR